MKKSFLPTLAFCTAVLVPFTFSIHAETSNPDIQSQIDAIEKQRDALLAQQKVLESELDTLNGQSQSLSSNIKTLDATRTKLLNDLKVTQNGIIEANLKVEQLGESIASDETAVEKHEAAITTAMQELSAYDKQSLFYSLLTSSDLSEVWGDETNLSTVQGTLADEITALNQTKTELTQDKASIEAQKASLTSLQNQLSGQKQVVESTQAAKQTLLNKTKSQEAAYQKLLADNQAQEKAFEDQLFQYQEQLKAAPASEAPSARHGILTWPLTTIRITQQFGRTADSVRLYASGTHSGTDFGASVGTPVMAMQDGVISGMGNTDDEKGCLSYGRWLFINYTVGLSSIYGHLSSIIVKTGDTVKAGQVVAYSGGQPGVYGSGYATGPHLHVGLFNSAGVSIQQYTSSIGCKQVSIPLANPSDYLDPMAYLPAL